MYITGRHKRIIDMMQWVAIAILFILCAIVFVGNKKIKADKEIMRDNTYVRIYESQTIESLRKENTALIDSINLLNRTLNDRR